MVATTTASPTAPIQSLCVFCGSGTGSLPAFAKAAHEVGEMVAKLDITLVYGGARVGNMKTMADAALAAGGKVIGVMPRALVDVERAHTGLTQLLCVDDMHERKDKMAQLSDACMVLPGGIGTLDEFFEFWTGAYLGTYQKPIGLCDVAGYYTPLVTYLDTQVRHGFLSDAHRRTLYVDESPRRLLNSMSSYKLHR